MRKLSLLLFTILIIASCTKEHPKDYITFSGKLENNKDSILTVVGRKGIIKRIKIDSVGSFKDTLKVSETEVYTIMTSRTKRAPLFLKNGFDIKLQGDANEFMTSFKFSGDGAKTNNYIIAQSEFGKKAIGNPQEILNLEKEAFDDKLKEIERRYDSLLNEYKGIDSTISNTSTQMTKRMIDNFNNAYQKNLTMGVGKPSPKFNNYVDIKGGTKSLDSFKGKYVYIDVWATWCGPCIKEIPSLQQLEKEYKNKNIAFVSISTDESRRSGGSWEKAEQKWREFVKKKNMSGVQLWSGQDYSFQQAYQINTIPRFILIDPQGNIVSANAPRPSDPNLKSLFTSLGI